MDLKWYGPSFKRASEKKKVLSIVNRYCGRNDYIIRIFGLMYDAPIKKNFTFLFDNRLFVAIQEEKSLLVIEEDFIKIKTMQELWIQTPVECDKLHFMEEFEHYIYYYGI